MRTRAINIFANIFTDVDCILTPTTAITAPVIPKDTFADEESDLPLLSALMRFITTANLTGHPAISVPIGYDKNNMPVGIQIIGRPWEESILLKVAENPEQSVEQKKPMVYRSPLFNC